MNQYLLLFLAMIGGVFLTVQSALNAQLTLLLRHPMFTSVVAFFCSAVFALVAVLLFVRTTPTAAIIKQVPFYLWFTGGGCSVLGISLYYYVIPKLGLSTTITFGLFGQLFFAVIAGHYGWFHLPSTPISTKKIIGMLALVIGIAFINSK
ncbi:MAG: DMT family transporter [Aureispira sp.]